MNLTFKISYNIELALSQENNVMDNIWYRNPEVIGRCGGDEKHVSKCCSLLYHCISHLVFTLLKGRTKLDISGKTISHKSQSEIIL